MAIPFFADPATAAAAVGPVPLKTAKILFKKISTNPGSKVKMGEFAEAAIEMYGDKACIQLNESGCQVLLLTSDNVQSCEYVKKKKKPRKGKFRTYYYYNIYYTDGSSSYVRMRKKYRNAMLSHM